MPGDIRTVRIEAGIVWTEGSQALLLPSPSSSDNFFFFGCLRGFDLEWVILSGSTAPHPSLIVSHLFCIP